MKRYSADNFTGCLVGGAIGDALGYPVEFMEIDEIVRRFGEDGVTGYSLSGGEARISDDTQMTLFTANGLLAAATSGGMGLAGYIYSAYMDWLRTQKGDAEVSTEPVSWLINVDDMYAQRSPGNTCISVLSAGRHGSVDDPVNNSKGSGGIMRVAPIGLMIEDEGEVMDCAAGAAALTHGNPLGYIPAAAYALIINRLINTDDSLLDCVAESVRMVSRRFRGSAGMERFVDLMARALELAAVTRKRKISVEEEADIIAQLGAGWVAEETLAISVYCALAHENDITAAVCAAVNHSGDSDSTGSLTGAMLGAFRGSDQLPMNLVMGLELYDVITEVAEDLFTATRPDAEEFFGSEIWKRKYVDHTYS